MDECQVCRIDESDEEISECPTCGALVCDSCEGECCE